MYYSNELPVQGQYLKGLARQVLFFRRQYLFLIALNNTNLEFHKPYLEFSTIVHSIPYFSFYNNSDPLRLSAVFSSHSLLLSETIRAQHEVL